MLDAANKALQHADTFLGKIASHLSAQLQRDRAAGNPDASQYALHGYAWMATYVEGLRQMVRWAEGLAAQANLGEMEELILRVVLAEYLTQLTDGVPMSQGEIARPATLGISGQDIVEFRENVEEVVRQGRDPTLRVRLAELAAKGFDSGNFGELGLDETQVMVLEAFRRFADDEVQPHCHAWHLEDRLIPIEVVNAMAEMGVFGLTIPEEYGGAGMSKIAMAIVSEELSRGYIGVGSLATRSEIAAELIRLGGTAEQKAHYLPLIARGEILPTAVFTEPNTGSDLGSLSTRAARSDGSYVITGAKTWITHASRSDLMMVLARTGAADQGYRTLSMFLAEKPRGTDEDPFPIDGLTGGEIKVLGYRGMKEYELSFDGFAVPETALLGGIEGEGFKQLMSTFESARVQTAARAVGVAQNAMELGLRYALERYQFGEPLISFPRVSAKIGWMVAETMMARQLTYFAAREKDSDRRCDVEAGMAKLLAARVAWSNADNALQIHGGNGYAEEYSISRVLCDARILNIFEGAAEIQAQVIARRLLAGGN
ncbi:acyl-CoA dehydrogenase family protein [Sphingobium sp. SCG-1]|uniref:acyl-CoA dehydrogenase family protein n=1 Tax=Sphingobium sp. SCG-1 TaxID=2072936 RepID=UPI001CB88CEE|nr:acyl-CoA dehydrogenase family protein [Sphingobium sp. SCG-1]